LVLDGPGDADRVDVIRAAELISVPR